MNSAAHLIFGFIEAYQNLLGSAQKVLICLDKSEDQMRSRVHSAIVGVLLFCAIVVIGHSATITVTDNNDSGPGSLRRALADANDGHALTFAVSGTLTLTSG